MKRVTIILAAAMVLLGATAAHAGFNRIEGYVKCDGKIAIQQGGSDGGTFFGDWYELASSVSVSGSGVSASLSNKMNGAQNNARGEGMIGSVDITISVSSNAAAGNRTLRLRFPNGGEDEFTIKIVPLGRITGATLPTLQLGFTQARIVLTGTNIDNPENVNVRTVSDPFNPNSAVAGGSVPGSLTAQIVSSTSTSVTIDLLANVGLEKITVDITLRKFGGCSSYPTTGLTRRVTLQAAQPSQPFITRISMPQQGTSVNIGSVANFEIQLNKPAPNVTLGPMVVPVRVGINQPAFDLTHLRSFNFGTVIYWRVAPPESVQGVTGDVPYNSSVVLNRMVVPPGESIKRFKLKIVSMPAGGSARQGTAILQTWIGNTNKFTAPEYFEFPFTIVNPLN